MKLVAGIAQLTVGMRHDTEHNIVVMRTGMVERLIRLTIHSLVQFGGDRVDDRLNSTFVQVWYQTTVFVGLQVIQRYVVPEFIDFRA